MLDNWSNICHMSFVSNSNVYGGKSPRIGRTEISMWSWAVLTNYS